jgi:hypothetical protein
MRQSPTVLLCLSPLCAGAMTPADGYVSYSGTASAHHSSQFLYGERDVLHYQGGRLTERVQLYTCRDGSAFARKLVGDQDPLAPNFALSDAANGMQQGIRGEAQSRIVYFRASATDTEKSAPVPHVDGLVSDTGFDEFVRRNWSPLMSGGPVTLRFLVPSRLQDYAFQAQHLRSAAVDGVPAELFRLRLSGFWGWLLPGIDVSYSASDHQLVRYEGLSDLRNPAGDNFKADIDFPPQNRQSSSEQAMRDARQAPLARCP